MKAVDFIRKFGWEMSKAFLDNWSSLSEDYGFKADDLKTYVDAWDLVESYGGLNEAGFHVYVETIDDCYFNDDLKQAIELVESVNENQD